MNIADDLDRADCAILRAIQLEARLSSAELAERVSLTASPTWRRIKRLEETGHIRGYHADLDRVLLGWGVTAFVSVNLENHRADLGDAFERAVAAIPQIVCCHNVSGAYDFFLEVVATDLESFGHFARTVLRTLPGVKELYSSFSLKAAKPFAGLPLPER